jgi:NADP-dependent 3-hydroxy acid dehydrogenase YdfG
MQPSQRKVILVTGASSGIGQATAALLAQEGHTVFGTSRRPGANRLHSFDLIALDVTSDESVAACVQTVLERAGRIDVLVNNAGADLPGAVEEISIDDAKWLFDTNFFGVVRMVKAVLPIMRGQGGGQIITLTSALGRTGIPFETYYTATKHALEGFSESLRHEVMPFHIAVSLVEPGFFQSNIRASKRPVENALAIYEAQRTRVIDAFDHSVAHGKDPAILARAIRRIIDSPRPAMRYTVGYEAVGVAMAKRFAPYPMLEKYMRYTFGLDDWQQDAQKAAPFVLGAMGLLLAALGLRRRR